MNPIYRGDTLRFDYTAELEDGTAYEFQPNDIIRVGIKDRLTSSKYVLYKEININEVTPKLRISFSADEMKKCSLGDKLLEIELTDTQGNVYTLSQEKLTIVGDVING